MKERPILFNGDMVRAILDGRKTQTRRVIKPQPKIISTHDGSMNILQITGKAPWFNGDPNHTCPYGVIGDRLWVRETWGLEPDMDEQLKDDGLTPGQIEYEGYHIGYKADGSGAYCVEKWRPSIFMPRWASRIMLDITDVRVERLQEISEDDAQAEGVGYWGCDTIEVFEDLWNSINQKRGYPWSSNPWVWVIEFKVLEPAHV
jgi:hypothetical protein